jgi:hypothetical protein
LLKPVHVLSRGSALFVGVTGSFVDRGEFVVYDVKAGWYAMNIG